MKELKDISEEDLLKVRVDATRDQINVFKGSLLWKDMVRELNRWKEMFQLEQSSVIEGCMDGVLGGAGTLLRIGDLRGREKTVDYLLLIPDIFLQVLEDKKNESRRE